MNTSKIHKSNDYSKFHFIDGNRPIANRKTGLEKSIEAIGYYGHAFPSVVMSYKKKLYILDGQHRYMEAQKRDEAFYYVLVNDI